ncbi:MAG: hypothetical protein ACR2KK_22600 [Acidimicrobiales bacterium]
MGTEQYTCADIVTARSRYYRSDDASKPRLESYLTTATPSCREVTYTIYVYDDDKPGAALLASTSVEGNGDTTVRFRELDVDEGSSLREDVGADTTIYLVVTSSDGRDVVYDREPDTGCVLRDLNDKDPLEWGWIP